MRSFPAALALLTLLLACSPAASPTTTAAARPRMQTARAPSLVPTRAGQELVYELVLSPAADGQPFSIDRIEVNEGSNVLGSMDGAAITASMNVRGADHNPVKPLPTVIGANQEAVVFMMHTVPNGAKVADHLVAKVTLRYADGQTDVASLDVPVLPFAPVVLGPPLRGGAWMASNALSNTSGHRRALMPFPTVNVPERYAIDYLLVSDAGRVADEPGTRNENHYAYGKELLAVGDGTVAKTLDGLPDNTPPTGISPVTEENISGNMVIIALDAGHHVFYAHLVPGSLKVKPGDRVKKGDVIGLLGNSGNSSAAHLHIHVSDQPSPLRGEGLPFVFESFTYVGKIAGGTGLEAIWGPRANEPQSRLLPLEDEVNAF